MRKGDSKKTRRTFEKEPRYFRKFKVALNPMYKIFLNLAKSCVLSCLSKVDNIKNFTVPFLNYRPPKAVSKGGFKRSYCCYGNLLCQENDDNVFNND